MDRLSGLDASFLYLESSAQLLHVCGVIVLDPDTIPGSYSFDSAVIKNVHLSERFAIQLRAEAYNILNHANSYLVLGGTNDVNNTPYAQVQKNGPGQGGNRQLQLAGKLIF